MAGRERRGNLDPRPARRIGRLRQDRNGRNPRGRDHSTFLSFAPKDNPKIAISVYVENGGFGASAALPIASLLEEYYLTDTIRRPELLQYIKDMNIYYPAYDK